MVSRPRPLTTPSAIRALALGALVALLPGCEFFLGVESETTDIDTTLTFSLPLQEPPDTTPEGEHLADPVFLEVSLREVSSNEGTGAGAGVSRAINGNIVSVRINRIDHVIDDPNDVALRVLPMSIRAGALGADFEDADEVGQTRELQARGFGTQRADVTPEHRVAASDVMAAGVFLLGAQPRYEIPESYNGGVGTATTTLSFDLTVTVE